MKNEVFPYLIAASFKFDYTTVICPKIFDSPFNLAKATSKVDENAVACRRVLHKDEIFYIAYKREKIINSENSEAQFDSMGRPLFMLYGFMTISIEAMDILETLNQIKSYIQPQLEFFLSQSQFKMVKSDIIILEIEPKVNNNNIIFLEDYSSKVKKEGNKSLEKSSIDLSNSQFINDKKINKVNKTNEGSKWTLKSIKKSLKEFISPTLADEENFSDETNTII